MDIQPQTTKPISDDQELAKVLAGVSQMTNNSPDLNEGPEPLPAPTPLPTVEPTANEPAKPVIDYSPPSESLPSIDAEDLAGIKKDALIELRPLIDKLDLAPEEKFDIYLLLLRSTDDTTLIAPAHLVAQGIADESRRAQALLDIIKEIDYLSVPAQLGI